VIGVTSAERGQKSVRKNGQYALRSEHIQTRQVMSVLDDFARMRLYRTRASEFEMLAETESFREARRRYHIIARHYRELANREERGDQARMAQHLELLRLKRRKAAE
jgi:hypothetical protein